MKIIESLRKLLRRKPVQDKADDKTFKGGGVQGARVLAVCCPRDECSEPTRRRNSDITPALAAKVRSGDIPVSWTYTCRHIESGGTCPFSPTLRYIVTEDDKGAADAVRRTLKDRLKKNKDGTKKR